MAKKSKKLEEEKKKTEAEKKKKKKRKGLTAVPSLRERSASCPRSVGCIGVHTGNHRRLTRYPVSSFGFDRSALPVTGFLAAGQGSRESIYVRSGPDSYSTTEANVQNPSL